MTDTAKIEEIRERYLSAYRQSFLDGLENTQRCADLDYLLAAYDEAVMQVRRTEAAAQGENDAHCRAIAELARLRSEVEGLRGALEAFVEYSDALFERDPKRTLAKMLADHARPLLKASALKGKDGE